MEDIEFLLQDNTKKVLIFIKENCQFCIKAVDHLRNLGVEPVPETIDELNAVERIASLEVWSFDRYLAVPIHLFFEPPRLTQMR